MGGKWPIFAVLGLGLVASLAVAVLMAALRSGPKVQKQGPVVQTAVLVCLADLPAMTRIEQSHIEVREVAASERPKNALKDPVQVLGRVLKIPLVAGQAFTETVLLTDEEGAKVASSLPEGYRAVSIELPASSAMRGLLYPGCRVDVIVAYKRLHTRSADGPTSRTLLQNVGVLAVEDRTVFSTEEQKPDGDARVAAPRQASRTLMVTLMLDPQQARELQASRDLGDLALAMRNPLDATMTTDPTIEPELEAIETVVGPTVTEEAPWRTVIVRGDKTEVLEFGGGKKVEEPERRYADAPTQAVNEVDE